MDPSVSLPDPGEFDRGHHNGHAPGLVTHQLHPYNPDAPVDDVPVDNLVPGEDIPVAEGVHDPVDDPTPPGNDGVLPLHPAAVTDLLTTPGFTPTPDLVDEQTRLLEQELRAHLDHLDHLDHDGLHDLDGNHCNLTHGRDAGAAEGGSSCNLTQQADSTTRHGSYCNLTHGRDTGPGEHGSSCNLTQQTDSTTRDGSSCNLAHTRKDTDPRTCPTWCADADLPLHGDGFDTTPEKDIPHRGVPREIPARHGGENPDHTGRAHITLQLEQDRDRTTGPVITLSIVIRGIDHTTWLTTAETTALHHTLNQMLDDTTRHR